jgi:hypothetical protein
MGQHTPLLLFIAVAARSNLFMHETFQGTKRRWEIEQVTHLVISFKPTHMKQ